MNDGVQAFQATYAVVHPIYRFGVVFGALLELLEGFNVVCNDVLHGSGYVSISCSISRIRCEFLLPSITFLQSRQYVLYGGTTTVA